MARFTDDLFHHTEGSDFIVRDRLPLATQIVLAFTLAFVVIYFTACGMSITGGRMLFFVTLTLTIGLLSGITVFFAARLRDLVLATEFQNAMLASAARLSTRFCLIAKGDGAIVYVDPGFQKFFPHFLQSTGGNIEGLLASAGIAPELIGRIFIALQQGENDHVLLSLRDESGSASQIMLSVEVLPRPKGYFLLRGRNYVEKRKGESAPAGPHLAGSAVLESALNALPEGIVVTDGSGSVTYINRTLESWLGYGAGELAGQSFKLGQFIHQYGGRDTGQIVTDPFDGEIMFRRKDKSTVMMDIKQARTDKTGGISAIIRLKKVK